MRLATALVTLALAATPGLAQIADRALCEPETIVRDENLLPPELWEEVAERGAAIPNGTGRLWRITTGEGAVSHLWGTMHSPDPRISNPPPILRDLIATADTVMLEYIAADISQHQAEAQLAPPDYSALTPNNLFDTMPAEAATGLAMRLRQLGYAEGHATALDPSFLLFVLLGHPCTDRLTMAGYPIQDTRIELLGADAGAALIALDPPDLLTSYAHDPQWTEEFAATVTLFALWQLEQSGVATAYDYYLSGRIGEMLAFDTVHTASIFPNIDVAGLTLRSDGFILGHRNENMAKRALPVLRRGNAVLAAGAFHLPGDSGLVEILRRHGFTVERVRVPGEAP
ncbi:TraB/GumN family protein [Algicella marina]|uniref:TraB/GumN family protein n=1 Tax=Algicella marina TaxID=2683284 RepID=A0A6P1T2B5_9RHOB|nr:TraB/GumN family protein [Algicella marina]QHQ35895.1 hypothetical protein GO499_12275 [Algicella marina]